MIFKTLALSDLDVSSLNKIISLDSRFFPNPWSDSQWRTAANHDYYQIFFDESFDVYSLYQIHALDHMAHLLKILVDPRVRTKGIGNKLLKSNLCTLSQLGVQRVILEVDTENDAANALYNKNGFKKLHCKKKFYSNGHDAYVLEKHLLKLPNN